MVDSTPGVPLTGETAIMCNGLATTMASSLTGKKFLVMDMRKIVQRFSPDDITQEGMGMEAGVDIRERINGNTRRTAGPGFAEAAKTLENGVRTRRDTTTTRDMDGVNMVDVEVVEERIEEEEEDPSLRV